MELADAADAAASLDSSPIGLIAGVAGFLAGVGGYRFYLYSQLEYITAAMLTVRPWANVFAPHFSLVSFSAGAVRN